MAPALFHRTGRKAQAASRVLASMAPLSPFVHWAGDVEVDCPDHGVLLPDARTHRLALFTAGALGATERASQDVS